MKQIELSLGFSATYSGLLNYVTVVLPGKAMKSPMMMAIKKASAANRVAIPGLFLSPGFGILTDSFMTRSWPFFFFFFLIYKNFVGFCNSSCVIF